MNTNDPISAALDALHNQNLLAAENARLKADLENCRIALRVKYEEVTCLKAEVAALRKELADAQESYHLCNERIATLLRQQSRE
jgi:chromosome segregation ATPase